MQKGGSDKHMPDPPFIVIRFCNDRRNSAAAGFPCLEEGLNVAAINAAVGVEVCRAGVGRDAGVAEGLARMANLLALTGVVPAKFQSGLNGC